MKNKGKRLKDVVKKQSEHAPVMAYASAGTSTTTYRRGAAAADTERTDRFNNIRNGLSPFHYNGTTGNIDCSEPIELCRNAYYNFHVFRNVIDLMTEFSVSNLYLRGGSKKSRDFFLAWIKKLGLDNDFQDQFFREYYRGGLVPIYRFDGVVEKEDLDKINQAFAVTASKLTIPVRYIILNPTDIQMGGAATFVNAKYYKLLSGYELERLRNPKTDEDRETFAGLPPETRKQISSKSSSVLIHLDPKKSYLVFYKKQDYEPFAVPMGYPVLDDINWKEEMKKMDRAITRTMQQAILLVTMGAEPEKGGVNQKHLEAMQKFFENESVGRVLIADYTTKASFVIPEIASLLDPKKYAQVDKDIQLGLNNVLIGDEKFANQHIKVQIFVERLMQARKSFLDKFLIPEIKRVAKDIGLKNYPTPYFEDINLKDPTEFNRVVAQLLQMGVLTPEEGIHAMETGVFPSAEDSLENQKLFKGYRDEGLYQPIAGGPANQMELLQETNKNAVKMQTQQQEHDEKTHKRELKHQADNPVAPAPSIHIQAPTKAIPAPTGRPAGTKRKQSTKKVSPSKASYLLSKVKDNLIQASKLQNKVEASLKTFFKIESLSADQKSIAEQVADTIVANETPDKWEESIASYIENPIDTNPERIEEIEEIASEHQIETFLASILYHSKCQETE